MNRVVDILVIVAVLAVGIFAVWSSSHSTTASGEPDATSGLPAESGMNQPVITELMTSNNSALAAGDSGFYDWIEIYNPTDASINLAGYGLTDDISKGTRFLFPTMTLEPGHFAIVYASGLDEAPVEGELHASFRLSSSGETLVLVDSYGNPIQRVDIPPISTDQSYVIDMTQLENSVWSATERYTPGYANNDEGWAAFSETRHVENSPIVISEVMVKNRVTLKDEDGVFADWVEIYNRGSETVNIGGYGLSNKENRLLRWQFPSIDLEPGAYLLVFCGDKNSIDLTQPLHAPFSLNSQEDTVILSNDKAQILDRVVTPTMESDQSYARVPNSDEWEIRSQPTPGYSNDDVGYNAFQEANQAVNNTGIRISEVMNNNVSAYAYADGVYYDYIELENFGTESVSLAGFGLTDDPGKLGLYTLPDVTLAPGEKLLINASGLGDQPSETDAKKKYHTTFGLSAEGETVVLTDPQENIVDTCMMPRTPINVSYGRSPGSALYAYMTDPTPGAANSQGVPGRAANPVLSLASGNYDEPQEVTIQVPQDTQVYYTLDGSVPDTSDTLYTGPITISQTAPLRAVAFREGYLDSEVITSAIFIGEGRDVPIVSVTVEPGDMFDPVTGIHELGPNADPEYPHSGANYLKNTEVPIHLDLIESDGTLGISQNAAIRIFGAYSRRNESKSFALMARGAYGPGTFNYQLFEDRPYTEFHSFIVRNGASEWNQSKIRDVLTSSLAADTTDLDTQAFRPCKLFINGEFWGVYFIQEKVTDHFLASRYNIDEESIDLLVGNGNKASYTVAGSNEDWMAIVEYVKTHGLTNAEDYAYIQTKIDVLNYADYVAIETYSNNSDTGNIKFWRSDQLDGKWRWILYDTDWGFRSPESNFVEEYFDPRGHGSGNAFDTTLSCALLKNEEWRALFLERAGYHYRETFNTEHVLSRIDEIVVAIEPEMQRDRERWGLSYTAWQRQIETVRDYARVKPANYRAEIQEITGATDEEMQRYFGD